MSVNISPALRDLVARRANYRCEYCRTFESDSYFAFHIDHIISLKHGGSNHESNLAYSCQICNLNKGTDIFTFLQDVSEPIRFFNPRIDAWSDHFRLDTSGEVLPNTPIAMATLKILNLNHPESVIERKEMIQLGIF